MLRLFVCIWLPDSVRKKAIDFQKKIMKLPLKAKFVEPENMHITITFLGETREEEIVVIEKKLESLVKNVKPFHVKLEGIKVIPNESFIRVIGIEVKDDEELSSLIKRTGELIDGKYYTKEKLTLCRVKKVNDKRMIKEFINKNRDIILGEFNVNSLSLVKSTLTTRGPIYETIRSFSFKQS